MKLSNFKYTIPKDLVATYPLDNRDDSRMLVVDRATGAAEAIEAAQAELG